MKRLHKGQRGFSLVELVIVIGLTGIVAAGITGAIMGVFNMDARTRNDMTAVYQVRQAGKLVSEDILEAQKVEPDPNSDSGFPLSLNWTEVGETPNTYKVVFKLADMPGGLKILWREYYINPDTNPDPVSTTKVAEYIDPDNTSCAWDGKVLTFTVTATVGEQSKTEVYKIMPRPGS